MIGSRVLAAVAIVLLLGALAVPSAAQDAPTPPAGEHGEEIPPGEGLQPTGSPEPPTSQRVIDTLVWFWLLACLAVAAVVGCRYVVSIWRSDGSNELGR